MALNNLYIAFDCKLLFTKARVAPVQPEEQIRATDYQINELEEQLAELL